MWKKGIYSALAFILILICISPPAFAGLAEENSRKRIAIILDNSDSMIVQSANASYLTRWAEATYALRTLLNMIDNRDEVALYTVADIQNIESGSNRITISENVNKDNIDQNLSRVGISAITKTYGMEEAYRWAARAPVNTEKWVVILSDGEFYGEDTSKGPLSYEDSVGKRALTESILGIHTIFIGMDVPNEDLQALRNRYSADGYNTFIGSGKGGNGIEQAILDISEKIYGMNELDFSNSTLSNFPEFRYDDETGSLIWKTEPGLSSYLEQVTIIAQMEDINEPIVPKDAKMRLVRSDNSFSWCTNEALESVLKEHDLYAKKTYHLLPAETFRKKIAETFLHKYCYVRTYTASEIGDSISFQAPRGNYTYRIYYELKENIIPELHVTQQGNEISPGPDGTYSLIEGEVHLGYRLMSGNTEIPQTLTAIRPEVKRLLIDNVEVSGAEAAQWNFKYKGPEDSRHEVETVFRNERRENPIQINLDMKKYSLTIQAGQVLHIDKPEEALLVAETTLPTSWVEANIEECLRDGLEGTKDTHAALDLSGLEWKPENGKIQISIPMSVSSSKLDISADLSVQIVIDGMGREDNLLRTNSTVSAKQSIPETALTPAPKKPIISLPFWRHFAAYIRGAVGSKDVTSELTLENASVTGLEHLANIRWIFDRNVLGIRYAGSWRDTIFLLSQGKLDGKVVLEGTLYRNGEMINEHFRQEGTVSWAGTITEVCIVFLLFTAAPLLCIGALVMSATGKLMLSEFIGQLRGNIRDETFPIYWKWQNRTPAAAPLRGLPFIMSISFSMCRELPEVVKKHRICLYGTRVGYRLSERSLRNLPQEIVFVRNDERPTMLETTEGGLEFRILNEQPCILSCRKERSLLWELAAAVLFSGVVIVGTVLLYLIISGVCYFFC